MLYRKDGTKLDTAQFRHFDPSSKIGGSQSEIYINDDTLLKMYNVDSSDRYRMSVKLFELLKKLNDKNIVTLYEYFYNLNSKFYQLFSMDAYTMQLVVRRDGKLIDADRKEILEIIKSLDATIKRLSDKKIVINDMKGTHLIPTDNGITIIDPDMFYRSIRSKYMIYEYNKAAIILALDGLLYGEFGDDCFQVEPIIIQNNLGSTLYELVKSQLQEDTIRENQLQKKKRR